MDADRRSALAGAAFALALIALYRLLLVPALLALGRAVYPQLF